MSDLSQLLDELYTSPAADDAKRRETNRAVEQPSTPDWSLDEPVDELFPRRAAGTETTVPATTADDAVPEAVAWPAEELDDHDEALIEHADQAKLVPTRAPDWSSDAALDEAFASWVPGPSVDASPAERSMVEAVSGEPSVEVPSMDDWHVETAPDTFTDQAQPEPLTVARARWSPSDDDILPASRKERRSRRRSR